MVCGVKMKWDSYCNPEKTHVYNTLGRPWLMVEQGNATPYQTYIVQLFVPFVSENKQIVFDATQKLIPSP